MQLLEPIIMSGLSLRNKVFMAPMTRSRADNPDAIPTGVHAKYYQQRSTAGLIITEGTVVSPQGVGYVNVPGIYSEKQVEAWKKVTTAVHDKGGHVFMQLWHVGRISHPDFLNGTLPVAPSAINPRITSLTPNGKKESVTPKKLTAGEIREIVQDFGKAGENAIKAGFDGVEVHSSNGYLFHQFFMNCSNTRTDEYGGTLENKTRFFFEVLDALKTVIPENKIGVRLNPMLHGWSGITVDEETGETFDYIANRLNDYDLAYLHLTRPVKTTEEPYFIKDVIGHYRKIYQGFLVANGNYDRDSGEQELAAGRADAIAFGRPFISNPNLPYRFQNDMELRKPDRTTFYTIGEKGYTDYPSEST